MSAPTPRPTIPLPRARTDANQNLGISVLYLGPAKTGKTTCAMSWPDPFVFYFDHNMDGLLATNPLPPHMLVDDLKPEPIAALQQNVLPAIAAGRIGEITDRPVRTIVVDSLTVLLGQHLAEVVRGKREYLKGFDDYLSFLYKAENFISGQLTPLVRQGFNVVATCHLGEYGGDNTPTTRRPIIPGSFRDILCSKFGAVLLTCAEETKRTVTEGGVSKIVTETDHYVRTINPDRTYEGIGDSLGRPGGRFRPLPPRLDGRYPSLAKAWGLGE